MEEVETESPKLTSEKIEEIKDSNENSNCEKDEWMDIIGSGGLKKKILKEGVCDSRPSKGDSVVVGVKGRLEDGTEVEVLEDLEFTIGDGEVINGLDMVLPLMEKGEVADVYMEARFAYGEKGLPPLIPADAPLFYTVHLTEFKTEVEPEAMSPEERVRLGLRKRERGNWWFKRGDNQQAIACYKAAVDLLDDASDTYGQNTSPALRALIEERLKTLNNMAAAQMRVEALDVAVKTLDAVLMCQAGNVKALYRKGKILTMQGDAAAGLSLLTKALSLEPDSTAIQGEVAKARESAKLAAQAERSLYRRMLGIKAEPQRASTKKNDDTERYQTLRGIPVKLWGSIFIILLSALIAYNYGDAIVVNW